jgi:diacylglycerol O-acyltransferase
MKQLSGLDAAIWYLDSKEQPLHISALIKLVSYPRDDLDAKGVIDRLRYFAKSSDVLHLSVAPSPIPLSLPYWVVVEQLDFSSHIYLHDLVEEKTALAADELSVTVKRLLGELLADPLPKDRPPWQIHVINLGSEILILTKIHHALLDGAGGLRLLGSIVDPPGIEDGLDDFVSEEEPSVEFAPTQRPSLLSALLDLPQEAVSRLESAATFQETLSQLISAVADGQRGALPEVLNFGAPKLPFSGALRTTRSAESFAVETSKLRQVARRTRSTLNDVVLTVVALTIERYLDTVYDYTLESSPIVLMPISTRKLDHSPSHNQVAGQLIALPYGKRSGIETLSAVKEQAWRAKRLHSKFGPKILESFASSVASPAISPLVRLIGELKIFDRLDPVFNMIVSNVTGMTDELYLRGHLVDSVVPFGPLAEGAPLNITFLSYMDMTSFGVTSCPDLVRAPEKIGEIFQEVLLNFLDEVNSQSD